MPVDPAPALADDVAERPDVTEPTDAVEGAEGTETLHHSRRVRVVRRATERGSVVVKEPRGTDAARRLRHEHRMLTRLADVDGVVHLADGVSVHGGLVLQDHGAVALSDLAGGRPLPTEQLLDVATRLTQILADVHASGVVHRDVNPTNVLVDPVTGELLLTDFDAATTSSLERPGFNHTSQITGTLEYVAPEQTGRTGWTVDHRVDLYALGATLYELASGTPPFGTGPALDLVRAHLTEVPRPLTGVVAGFPQALCDVIGRLLEKDPDRRYQTADGLLHDLVQVAQQVRTGSPAPLVLGTRDFPVRLTPPARPVGRAAEISALTTAFDRAADRGGSVLVAGAAGVGKTTVVDQLRPVVTARGGWFVVGKFDEQRRDRSGDGVRRALRSLARLLLAEPEADLARHRERLLARLGPNTRLLATMVPELATLLDVEPLDPAEVHDGEQRTARAAVETVAAVADPSRPLVLVVDDLQWAGPTAVGVVDALVTDPRPGVLLVGCYRPEAVDAVHPLTARLSAWGRGRVSPERLALRALPTGDVAGLLAEMLRVDAAAARDLAGVVAERTGGNPFDTVELVNALRRDGLLTPTGTGWTWDAQAVRLHTGQDGVAGILAARLAALPADARGLAQRLACLGDRTALAVLTAVDDDPATVDDRLAPLVEEGLVVLETDGGTAVAFRHDRVREAAYASADRTALHHDLARRILRDPRLHPLAAEQLLAALPALTDPVEQREAATVLHRAATAVRLVDPTRAEQYLASAAALLGGLVRSDGAAGSDPTADDDVAAELVTVRAEHHAVLCGLGRFTAADELYAVLDDLDLPPVRQTAVARSRIASLRVRNRQPEALALGLELLGRLGLTVPTDETLPGMVDAGLDELDRWTATGDPATEVARPAVTDPVALAAAQIIDEILPVAYFSGNPVFTWLVVEAQRMWAEHGPAPELVAPLCHSGFMTIMLRGDHRTGYVAAQRALAVGQARGWEPQTSYARFMFALAHGPWFEPLPRQLELAWQAREGLQQFGSVLVASTYFASVPLAMDCAPTLEAFLAETEGALDATRAVGDVHAAGAYVGYRQLGRALQGRTRAPGDLSDDDLDLTGHLAALTDNPTARANVHTVGAVAAAIFGDDEALTTHSAAAVPLLPFIHATYLTTATHLVRALALARRLQRAPVDDDAAERAAAATELAEHRAWVDRRAEDSPGGFAHLAHLLEAEQRWADGDVLAAVRAFDAALGAASRGSHAWHTAFVAERAARFHLAVGLPESGRMLLARARWTYAEWGAVGKVTALDQEHPWLPVHEESRRTSPGATTPAVSNATIDILAVLDASRALSSATTIGALQEHLTQVLGAMTGASVVTLLRWDDDAQEWTLDDDGHARPLDDPAVAVRVATSVVRYVQRTRRPLLVADAVADDRFARDPHVATFDACSVMAVPIESRGAPKALLVLEKPGTRNAFTTERLDAVGLVAGQLVVSLENAAVYASLERQVAERTRALAEANARLEDLNRTDPLTGLANRRRLDEAVADEWARGRRTGAPVAVMMIDIDHFKPYNDTFGHGRGDECLRRVAIALETGARRTDLVARYGGEEFAVVLPGADGAAAAEVAERVRAAVEQLGEEHPGSPTGTVTVSVGVAAVVPSSGAGPDDLVNQADRALYRAKAEGRNRVARG